MQHVSAAERALLLALPLAWLGYAAPVSALTAPGRRLFPALTRLASTNAVALTFDDGPDRAQDAFLLALERSGATATFFVTGEQVARAPGLARELLAAGHELGVHGYRHRIHLRVPPWQVTDDLRRARATLEAATGQPTRLFRPPYGVFTLASWREAERQGWQRVLWSRWGWDWSARATADSIAAWIGEPRPGEILLLHDSDRYAAPGAWRTTLAALPRILDDLAVRGLAARAIGDIQACRVLS